MNSLKSILLSGAALMTAILALQTSTLAADVSQKSVEKPQQSVSQPAASERCNQCDCVCVDQKVTPQPVTENMDHEKKCKKYVRTQYGPPSKGFDRVEVVYVECPQ